MMSGLVVVILTIYLASRQDKEQWLFDRKRLTILALMFVIVGISWGLNDKIMKDPLNQNIRSDLLFNYSFPLLICMLGLFIKEIHSYVHCIGYQVVNQTQSKFNT